jgi:hypothetical protein
LSAGGSQVKTRSPAAIFGNGRLENFDSSIEIAGGDIHHLEASAIRLGPWYHAQAFLTQGCFFCISGSQGSCAPWKNTMRERSGSRRCGSQSSRKDMTPSRADQVFSSGPSVSAIQAWSLP